MSSLISPCRRWHGPQHVNGDDFVLGVGLSGNCCVVQQCGREAALTQGDAVLTSGADPARVVIPAVARPLSLRIPRSVLASRIPGLDDRTSQMIPPSAPLKLLTGYVAAICNSGVATMELRLRDIVVAHVHDLVCLVLGAEGDARELAEQRGARAARLAAILQAIDSGSANPRLSASAVAAALAITPRYVHVLLEETGKSFRPSLGCRLLYLAPLARPNQCSRLLAAGSCRILRVGALPLLALFCLPFPNHFPSMACEGPASIIHFERRKRYCN
jgi:hypothetical protein